MFLSHALFEISATKVKVGHMVFELSFQNFDGPIVSRVKSELLLVKLSKLLNVVVLAAVLEGVCLALE